MDDNETAPEPGPGSQPAARDLDLEALKGLAHPLRVRIVDTLSTYGPSTASGLAQRLGESSGATSYHLRQLERHRFVREVPGRGTGRERWWERNPGRLNLSIEAVADSPAGRAAATLVATQWQDTRERLVRDFVEHGDALPRRWADAGIVSSCTLRLTEGQLRELAEALERLQREFLDPYRGQEVPGSRPVHVQLNAFPVVDGEEIGGPETDRHTGEETRVESVSKPSPDGH